MINRKQIPEFVSRKKPFQGSNIYGKFEMSRYGISGMELFVVYSYGQHWPLLVSPRYTGSSAPYWEAQWIVNKDKYSCTTTRHLTVATNWLYAAEHSFVDSVLKSGVFPKFTDKRWSPSIVELDKVEHVQRWVDDWESEYRKYVEWKASANADYMAG